MIVGCGATVVDAVVRTVNPIVVRDKNPITREVFQVGGVIPTALMLLSRMGIPCALYSAVGHDLFGEFVLDRLKQESIDTSKILQTKDSATPVSIAVIEPGAGERTGFTARGFFSKLPEDTFDTPLPEGTRMVLIDGHNVPCATKLLQHARKQKIRSLMDLGTFKPGMEPLLELVDMVIAPHVYVKRKWPNDSIQAALSKLLAYGPDIAVVTMEAEGAMVATSQEVFHQAAYPVTVVDTNGAGDVFFGSFAYGMYSQWEPRSSAQFAAAVAALSCEHTEKDQKLLRTTVEKVLRDNTHDDQSSEALPIVPNQFKPLIE